MLMLTIIVYIYCGMFRIKHLTGCLDSPWIQSCVCTSFSESRGIHVSHISFLTLSSFGL